MAEYNGWTNYETWLVNLWLDEAGVYDYWLDAAWRCVQAAEEDRPFTRMEIARMDLSDELKDDFEDGAPAAHGFYQDLITAGLAQVNWDEIAQSLIDCVTDRGKTVDPEEV